MSAGSDRVMFTVEADKGFNYLSYDDSFVCQKKNHFQITVRTGLNSGSAQPHYIYDAESCSAVPIDAFYLHFYGIKVNSAESYIYLWVRCRYEVIRNTTAMLGPFYTGKSVLARMTVGQSVLATVGPLPNSTCWWQLVHLDQQEDARVFFSSVVYTVSILCIW